MGDKESVFWTQQGGDTYKLTADVTTHKTHASPRKTKSQQGMLRWAGSPTPSQRVTGKDGLLGDTKAVFVKDVGPGRSTRLQWMATHPRV